MERWIAVAINPETKEMRFIENAGGDQQTARRYASSKIPDPSPGWWVGLLPFDLVKTSDENYFTGESIATRKQKVLRATNRPK